MKSVHNELSTFGQFRPRGLMRRLVALTRASSTRWIGKRRAFFLRAVGLKVLRGKPIDVETLGSKMRLYPAHNNAEKKLLFTPQYFDAAERAFLLANMRDDFTFVDIGADIGGYSLFVAAHAGPRARILAIEPQPDIFERLIYNIRLNAFSTIKAIACAVADRDGVITLFVNPTNSGETSMRIVNAHAKGGHLEVQARSLAGLLIEEGFGRVDAMKLDVEGAEDLILEPFFADVPPAMWPVILIIEDAPTRWGIDLPALVRDHGYDLVARTDTNIIYRRA
ncbi:FkbM family methyltransferase [Lichenihabitans sp. PAMC28606]|uniref:FkbM family methyltransferase n=1 Tax=Lichenihabitans sp. PAMC28606 TaxID=2880932 RepID=UPI001D0A880B|nr:FkbM family methyltransferase [Lichenihabitans sp. PAMC28606]UDL94689.1 FkbM family methyltransferase [Lichenihabitans sp. PAMC28606]